MDKEMQLITIFFRHDQAKNLDEIQAHLRESGFWKEFPPEGMEIVNWVVMMGIGHVVTLRLPPSRLRELNMMVERKAWKAFTTEFYPTYDFLPHYQQFHEQALGNNA
ncbi:MAG TPA: hypothetical protein PKK59_08130 [Anaerolineaceae bacterium]|nr:hypothetical protein [Anaerolineaceae bacterium]